VLTSITGTILCWADDTNAVSANVKIKINLFIKIIIIWLNKRVEEISSRQPLNKNNKKQTTMKFKIKTLR
jgi:hypothetical protein